MSLEFSSAGEGPDVETVVGALDDDGCRKIVAVLEEPKTVDEIAEATGLPLSTTYRKLDRLTDASLVNETVGVRQGSHRKARYIADVERITIDLNDERRFRVRIKRAKSRAMSIWTKTSQEF